MLPYQDSCTGRSAIQIPQEANKLDDNGVGKCQTSNSAGCKARIRGLVYSPCATSGVPPRFRKICNPISHKFLTAEGLVIIKSMRPTDKEKALLSLSFLCTRCFAAVSKFLLDVSFHHPRYQDCYHPNEQQEACEDGTTQSQYACRITNVAEADIHHSSRKDRKADCDEFWSQSAYLTYQGCFSRCADGNYSPAPYLCVRL